MFPFKANVKQRTIFSNNTYFKGKSTLPSPSTNVVEDQHLKCLVICQSGPLHYVRGMPISSSSFLHHTADRIFGQRVYYSRRGFKMVWSVLQTQQESNGVTCYNMVTTSRMMT